MDNESKKPCAPVEEEGRDYNELGVVPAREDYADRHGAVGDAAGLDGSTENGICGPGV